MLRSIIKALKFNFLFKLNSYIWFVLLRLNGIKVGRNFYIEGYVLLKLNGKKNFSRIEIGENVKILGNIDLRTRERGSIFISNNVRFDTDIRLVAARSGKIKIRNNCRIGKGLIVNAGEDILIGANTLIGPNCSIISSNHGFKEPGPILGQPHIHSPIKINKGSWLGANVVILPGVEIGEGSVIGSSSVVTKNTESNSVNAGIPSKKIDNRF